jgi:hypothetical protein
VADTIENCEKGVTSLIGDSSSVVSAVDNTKAGVNALERSVGHFKVR